MLPDLRAGEPATFRLAPVDAPLLVLEPEGVAAGKDEPAVTHAPRPGEGENELEVHVSTVPRNYCRSLADQSPMAGRWCAWYPPIPMGSRAPWCWPSRSRGD